MRNLYPGYDVLSKRDTQSWNEQTRRVIDQRLAIDPDLHAFFSDAEWKTLCALCDCIVPQSSGKPRIPVPAMVDRKMVEDVKDGYRNAKLPVMREAWRIGLAAINAEAKSSHGHCFHELAREQQNDLIAAMQAGGLHHATWGDMPPRLFFTSRVLADIVKEYYAHPYAWNEIGWGGPASPRGYVRLKTDRRDPWEAAEAKPGREAEAEWENCHVGR